MSDWPLNKLTVPQDLTYHKQWCYLNVYACNVLALIFNCPGDTSVSFSVQQYRRQGSRSAARIECLGELVVSNCATHACDEVMTRFRAVHKRHRRVATPKPSCGVVVNAVGLRRLMPA